MQPYPSVQQLSFSFAFGAFKCWGTRSNKLLYSWLLVGDFFFFFSPGLHWLPPLGLLWFAVNISWVKSLTGRSHVYFGREHITTVFTCPCTTYLLYLQKKMCMGLNSFAKACQAFMRKTFLLLISPYDNVYSLILSLKRLDE